MTDIVKVDNLTNYWIQSDDSKGIVMMTFDKYSKLMEIIDKINFTREQDEAGFIDFCFKKYDQMREDEINGL